MADTTELWDMLRAADAAGDTAGAERITEMIDEAERAGTTSPTIQTMLSGMEHPVPVEAPWFPESDQWPGQTLAKETVGSLSSGIENIPNVVPNVVNTAKSLYDLHAGSGTGDVAPEDQWRPWMGKEGFVDYPFTPTSELHPPTPGWEDFRRYGEIAGSAAPAGPFAMVAAPVLARGGKEAGALADIFTGNTDTHKWERTLEPIVPLALGLGRTGAGAWRRSGRQMPGMGFSTYAITSAIDPALPALVAGAKTAGNVLTRGSRGSVGKDLASTLATTVAPMAVDDPRMRGRR